MKKILFDNASNGIQIDHANLKTLQDQNLQTVEAIVKSMYPDYTTGQIAIVHGCEVTDNGDGTHTVSEGHVYKDGEIYRVEAATVATPDGAVWSVSSIKEQAKFGNGVSYDIRDERKMVLTNGVSGSGIADLNQELRITDWVDLEYGAGGSSSLLPNAGKPQIRKVGNVVHLRGAFEQDTVSQAAVIIPTEYLPNIDIDLIGMTSDLGAYGTVAVGYARLIKSSAAIILQSRGTGTFYLYGISYSL